MVAMDTDMKALTNGLGSYLKLSPSAKSHQCKYKTFGIISILQRHEKWATFDCGMSYMVLQYLKAFQTDYDGVLQLPRPTPYYSQETTFILNS